MKLHLPLAALLLTGPAVQAFVPVPTTTISSISISSVSQSSSALFNYSTVEEAIAQAQRICAEHPGSNECAVAWDIVEELEAADSHSQPATATTATGQAQQVDTAALVASFNVLAAKIDGKMDQLQAVATQMNALGAPNMAPLMQTSQEMKQALAQAKQGLSQ